MKLAIRRNVKIILIILSLLIVATLAAFLLPLLRNKSAQNGQDTNNGDTVSTIDDTKPSPDPQTPPNTTKPEKDPVCNGNVSTASKFTLTSPARVYVTALDAKNKANQNLTYQPGVYDIYKCYDGMANITHTQGVPGGWIDPKNPNANPVLSAPDEVPAGSPVVDVMSVDNTLVNWSHEYPTTFVKEYNGWWNVSPGKLYLTFDCGYDYNNLASSILDTLRAQGARAVFFVTGDFMNDRPDLIKRMVNEGHVVGNHSYGHLNQPQNLNSSVSTVVSDIRIWEEKYRSIMGSSPSTAYFRPPEGAISRRSVALMNQLGYKTIMWGAAYKDWDPSAQSSKEVAMTLLRRYTASGDIILLHGVSQTSTDILGQYINEYRGKGFEFILP